MTIGLFSVFDAAANRFMDIFCAPTVEFAIRGFKEACQTDGHQFSKFPEDYALYQVGDFDSAKGVVLPKDGVKLSMAQNFVGIHGEQLDIEGRQA